MSELRDVITEYFKFRSLSMPNEAQAFQFLVSEVGELADALVSAAGPQGRPCPNCGADAVSSAGNWIRNNPDREKDIEGEAGDVLMMLYVTLMGRGIDPYEAMLAKFKQKGFNYEMAKKSAESDGANAHPSALRGSNDAVDHGRSPIRVCGSRSRRLRFSGAPHREADV